MTKLKRCSNCGVLGAEETLYDRVFCAACREVLRRRGFFRTCSRIPPGYNGFEIVSDGKLRRLNLSDKSFRFWVTLWGYESGNHRGNAAVELLRSFVAKPKDKIAQILLAEIKKKGLENEFRD